MPRLTKIAVVLAVIGAAVFTAQSANACPAPLHEVAPHAVLGHQEPAEWPGAVVGAGGGVDVPPTHLDLLGGGLLDLDTYGDLTAGAGVLGAVGL